MKRPSVITNPDIRLLWDAVEEISNLLTANMQGGTRVDADLAARVEALEAEIQSTVGVGVGFQPIPVQPVQPKRGPGRPRKEPIHGETQS